jgi:hypothetical protein
MKRIVDFHLFLLALGATLILGIELGKFIHYILVN